MDPEKESDLIDLHSEHELPPMPAAPTSSPTREFAPVRVSPWVHSNASTRGIAPSARSPFRAWQDEPSLTNSHPLQLKAVQLPYRFMETADYDKFLVLREAGNGELTVHCPDKSSFAFRNLNVDYIQEVCPLLGYSFEEVGRGRRTHSVFAANVELWSRFLRYIYTGTYQVFDDQAMEIACSFLMHAQLYHLGELYDQPQLVNDAYIHISQICELACSMGTPPNGLPDTLRFLYDNVKADHEVHEVIVHYCVARFNAHKMDADPDFIQLLHDKPEFARDLTRLNWERGFNDDGSSSIIRLQLPTQTHSKELPKSLDYLYDMFGSNFTTPADTPLLAPTTPSSAGFTLVHRPRYPGSLARAEDSDGYSSDSSLSSDFENFSLAGPSRPNGGVDRAQLEEDKMLLNTRLDALLTAPRPEVIVPRAASTPSIEQAGKAFEAKIGKNMPTLQDVFMDGEDDDDFFDEESFGNQAATNATTKQTMYNLPDATDSTETIVPVLENYEDVADDEYEVDIFEDEELVKDTSLRRGKAISAG